MENSNINKIIVPFLAVMLAGLLFLTYKNRNIETISVVGEGRVAAVPETVSLIATRVDVGTELLIVEKAGENVTKSLSDTAKKIGGKNTTVKKAFNQVTPQGAGKYVVANAISVSTDNAASVNDIIANLYVAGATTVSNVTFGLKSESVAGKDARGKAIEQAGKTGAVLAESMGKRLGKVVAISDDGMLNDVSGDERQVEIVKKVTVVYEIK